MSSNKRLCLRNEQSSDQSFITSATHINEEVLDDNQRQTQQKLVDYDLSDEEEVELEEDLDDSVVVSSGGADSQTTVDKSQMLSQFEELSLKNNTNNESNRQSEDSSDSDDELMDALTVINKMKVLELLFSRIIIGGDPSANQQKNDISNGEILVSWQLWQQCDELLLNYVPIYVSFGLILANTRARIDTLQQQKFSLMSRLVQKWLLLRGLTTVTSATSSSSGEHQMPIISSVRHINEKDLNDDQRQGKQGMVDEDVLDEEEDDLNEGLNDSMVLSTGGGDSQTTVEKSGMFSEFKKLLKNITNNESNRQSEDSCAADDRRIHNIADIEEIITKVLAGTSVSIGGDPSANQQKNGEIIVKPWDKSWHYVLTNYVHLGLILAEVLARARFITGGDISKDEQPIANPSNEDNCIKDPFSDMPPEIFQIILGYLSFKKLIRIEVVSKQFQSNILEIFRSGKYKNKDHLYLPLKGISNNQHYIELFRKLPKLTKLIIGSRENTGEVEEHIPSELIEVIIKYCNNLTHIVFDSRVVIEMEIKKLFFDKFAQQLVSLVNYGEHNCFTYLCKAENQLVPNILPIFTSAPNLEELEIGSFYYHLNQIQFNRLKKLDIALSVDELDDFDTFIKTNAQNITDLTIDFLNSGDFDNQNRQQLMTTIAKAINLVQLRIDGMDMITDQSLTNYWTQIAIKCKQIKSLRLHFNDNENMRINDSTLSILKQFDGLKRFHLSIDSNEMAVNLIQDLNDFEQITHLLITPEDESEIILNETILTNIDINFPNLKELLIDCPFEANEETIRVLKSLSCLEIIHLAIKNEEIIPEIKRQLKENCKQLKKFDLRFQLNDFDEEEEEPDSTNPMDLLNVNLSETDDSHNPLAGADMSSAAARFIASSLASFGTNLDLDSEASQGSQSGQYSGSPSVTISTVESTERRGKKRPPKYEMGTVFNGQSSTASTSSTSVTPVVITSQQGSDGSPTHQQYITSTPSSEMASTSSAQLSSLKCPHCPQIYYCYHAMRDHITSVHLNSGEKYICNLCNKEYTWRISLSDHLKFHHGVHTDKVGNA